MSKTQNCPGCGTIMVRDTRPHEVIHKDRSITIRQPAFYCTACDEAVLTTDDIRATEPAIFDFKARADGVLSATEITEIREKILKISQRRAGLLLGGGPRAFQKYESRQVTISRAMSNLLVLLGKHPDQLAELEGRHRVQEAHDAPKPA